MYKSLIILVTVLHVYMGYAQFTVGPFTSTSQPTTCQESVDGDYTIYTEKDYRYNYSWLVAQNDFLVVQIQSCKDAHLLLSTKHGHNASVGSVRIVIGGGGNQWSEISVVRNDSVLEQKAHRNTPEIMSCVHFQPYWISWAGRHVKVGKGCLPGDSLFIHWRDTDTAHQPIVAVTLSTWLMSSGEWRLGAHQLKRIHVLTPDAYRFTYFDAAIEYRRYLKMALRGDGTFHVALSSSYQKPATSTYEILIGGAGSNSTIRKYLRGPNVSNEEGGPGITNSTFTRMWLSWQGGLIAAGSGVTIGRQTFVSWKDDHSTKVKVVSLATSGGVGEWVMETPDMMAPEKCVVSTISQTVLQLTVSAQPGMGSLSGLKVNYTDENGNFYSMMRPVSSGSEISVYNVTGLDAGTIYSFSTWGYTSQESGDSCTATGQTELGAPGNVSVKSTTTSSIWVEFTDAPGIKDGYQITCSAKDDVKLEVCLSSDSCGCQNLLPGHSYRVIVQATRNGFDSVSGNDIIVETPDIATSTHSPTVLLTKSIATTIPESFTSFSTDGAANKDVVPKKDGLPWVPIVASVIVVLAVAVATLFIIFLLKRYRVGPFSNQYVRQRDIIEIADGGKTEMSEQIDGFLH